MKILIDAGHGGTDSGAVGKMSYYGGAIEQIKEKDLTRDFADSVKFYLEDVLGATVYMGREGDATVGINARSLVAHNNNVDAVLSIHFNSGGGGTARGVETFYAQTRSGDKAFATSIQNAVVNDFNPTSRGVKDDTKAAVGQLGILRNYASDSYPRALVEVEFIDNQSVMSSTIGYDYYERTLDFAFAIVNGFSNHFNIAKKLEIEQAKEKYLKLLKDRGCIEK